MLHPALAEAIAAAIEATTGRPFLLKSAQPVAGGCIHDAWLLHDGQRRFFVKTDTAAAAASFEAEADGLKALQTTGTVRVPIVGAGGTAGQQAFLILEYLELRSLDHTGGATLGEALARLHHESVANSDATYGWPRDNFIGGTPQSNQSHRTWAGFYATERLQPQLALASRNGMERTLRDQGERLAERLASFFLDYRPAPSLLHGDLWSGNAAQLAAGEEAGTPVIFDPAVYRGDREADIAMAELFGGFPESFYAAYRAAWPLDPGFETRKTLYNLYHVLNHFNLFGAGYLGQAQRMIARLNAELRG
ncbi:MAG: fructosamine kinase family protein [Gammaproteobacteria bacterium]|nr:fructosamine kinase family protein [Rhodocyclaceae bacterium]MBU3910595.1 fructosamine kinase family protein [Gammaproteobacteria bacterium]MBU3990708.1 fructosamine kinase family protein [Gammaproteobacteria bacterium]MBU4005076.1 fructosamine kinase family protein [Gammaproteobacteria bacterium]MBU4020669.1 fructosamine kinase family protein [Gammaproteobacteria bacterium]